MLDKMNNQTRMILAAVISFLVFGLYTHFFPPKKITKDINSTKNIVKNKVVDAKKLPIANTVKTLVDKKNDYKTIVKVESSRFNMEIDSLGRINKFYLNESKYKTKDGNKTQIIDKNSTYPLEIRFKDENINKEAYEVPYSTNKTFVNLDNLDNTQIVLTQHLTNLDVTKNISVDKNGHYSLEVKLSSNKEYFITPGFRSDIGVDRYTFHGAIIQDNKNIHQTIEDEDYESGISYKGAKMAASVNKYYSTVFYDYKNGMNVYVNEIGDKNPILFIYGNGDLKLNGYIGPKENKIFNEIDKNLEKQGLIDGGMFSSNKGLSVLIEYGWFTFIARPLFALMSFLYGFLGNWGWSIVLLTVIVKVVLFPLTYKGMVSMNKMKALAPKIKELKEKYKGDTQKIQVHTMELYKKHGANPLGGCLPMVIQIPVFFGIYRVLRNAVELKGAPWILWIHDLSVLDKYYILPILMGLTMFLQQRLTPTAMSMDKTQEKIMKFLPLIFTFFFLGFPAGLTLYWFVNNLLSIIQQLYVNKAFDKQKNHDKKSKEIKHKM